MGDKNETYFAIFPSLEVLRSTLTYVLGCLEPTVSVFPRLVRTTFLLFQRSSVFLCPIAVTLLSRGKKRLTFPGAPLRSRAGSTGLACPLICIHVSAWTLLKRSSSIQALVMAVIHTRTPELSDKDLCTFRVAFWPPVSFCQGVQAPRNGVICINLIPPIRT